MSKYGLSTKVYTVYKEEFHGLTVELYRTYYPTIWCYKAVCTDCHGVHDIRHTHDPVSSVHPDNLLYTCRKCHPGATKNFTDAWTGHYDPNPRRGAPVYYTKVVFFWFVAAVLGYGTLHVGLDMLRWVINRVMDRIRERREKKPWE
ncbi:MAG: hypothetical protein ACE5MB_01610 [Anaerolineae bacterium]